MTHPPRDNRGLSRRKLLKSLSFAPLLLRSAPLHGASLLFNPSAARSGPPSELPFADVRLTPHYPAKSPLADVLRLVAPGSDDYITEKYAVEIETLLEQWSRALKESVRGLSSLANSLHPLIEASRSVH